MTSFRPPTDEQRDLIFERPAEGRTPLEIAAELNLPRDRWSVARWVERVLHRYDPHVDEVAVRRAMQGDRPVYRRLTPAERVEFTRRAAALFAERGDHGDLAGLPAGSDPTDSRKALLGALHISESHWRTLVGRAFSE